MVTNRSKGQTMIGCWCDESFVEKIDNARGGINRSQFCRDALTEKLEGMGITVGMFERYAPDRRGKGGPKKKGARAKVKSRSSSRPLSEVQRVARRAAGA